jgi:hypothetical protein
MTNSARQRRLGLAIRIAAAVAASAVIAAGILLWLGGAGETVVVSVRGHRVEFLEPSWFIAFAITP